MKSEITEFVKQTIKDIEMALPKGYEISDDIRFEINVTKANNSGGKMDIKIVSADNKVSESIVHKIQFEVSPKVNEEVKMKDTFTKLETLVSGAYSIISTIQNLNKPSTNNQITEQ